MKHKVIIRRCDDYDAERIQRIISEGIHELGITVSGRTILKPNCVMAHPELFPYAFTRPEFIEGTLKALFEHGAQPATTKLGERSGITIPTRFCFKNAGYMDLAKRNGIKIAYFDEEPHLPYNLKHVDRLRDTIYLPKSIIEAEFFVNLPKFKAHPWTRLTLSLKNLIGIQDDRHRLLDHNTYLEHKIADLSETVPEGFIAIDGITAGQKMMLTPTPFPLGAIIMGTNSCAVDSVCCHMVNVDPIDVIHLKVASQRSKQSFSLDDIEISGDYPLNEIQAKTRDFEFCMEHIDSYFGAHGNLNCIVGKFPEDHSKDYCWGGCPGALQEAMHIFEMYYPGIRSRMGKIKYVVGEVDGPIQLEEDERVIFIGDCTKWAGLLDGKKVEIESNYTMYDRHATYTTQSNDMLLKILGSLWDCFVQRKSRYVHAWGCPVSVAAHINYLSFLAGIPNINFDKRNLLPVNLAYMKMRANRFINRFVD
jgi:uncharacterized protein (DUF362 family)